MNIINLSSDELISLLNNKDIIGLGSNGLVLRYNDDLIKLYYKKYIYTYLHPNKCNLDNEIDINISFENKKDDLTSLEELVNNFSMLKNTSSNDLIKGIAVYRDYPVGIILNYYKDYYNLSKVYYSLSNKNKILVLDKIKYLINNLISNNIIPLDIREDNVLVNDKLDVVLIDLDDIMTKYVSDNYMSMYPYVKKQAFNKFEIMVKRLDRNE